MKKEKPKSSWKRVISYFWMHARKYKFYFLATYIAYSIAVITDSVLIPYFYKSIIDSISSFLTLAQGVIPDLASPFAHTVFGYFTMIVVVLILDRLLYTIGDYSMSIYQSRAMKDIANFAFQNMINHSYQFFTNSFIGSLVKKAGRFVSSFENSNDIVMYGIWIPVTKLVSVFAVLFFVAPFIGWMYFIWTIIFFILSLYLAQKRMSFDLAEAEADSRTTGQLADVLSNVLNIKLFSSRKIEEHSFDKVTTLQMNARTAAWKFQNFTYLLQGLVVTWLQVMSLYVSISLWFDGLISLGIIVLAYSYSNTIFDSVWGLGKQLSKISKSFSDAAEMVDIIDEPIEIKDSSNPEALKMKEGKIFFDNVGFAYKSGIKILDKFNLTINAGERVGVVGTSGAGKTTLTKILLRFADVTEGAIKIDGQDIRNVTQDDLRSVVSYVPQDPILFHRSLAENIGYGRPGCSMEEIIDAAKKAHAHEFIESLSHGYDTLVGERGVKLSGGERQRVAIARAILKNAPILILDEATSALDSVSETHIKEALEVLMKGKTTIVIAHRLSTIEKMDRIIVMEKGKIVEEGNHKELVAKKGIYQNFWEHQYGGFIK